MVLVHHIGWHCDLLNLTCHNCLGRSRMWHWDDLLQVSYEHSVNRCRSLSRRSCRRMADRTQCWHACASFHIALADVWFGDCQMLLLMATLLRLHEKHPLNRQMNLLVRHTQVLARVDHKRFYVLMAALLNQLLVHHNVLSARTKFA